MRKPSMQRARAKRTGILGGLVLMGGLMGMVIPEPELAASARIVISGAAALAGLAMVVGSLIQIDAIDVRDSRKRWERERLDRERRLLER